MIGSKPAYKRRSLGTPMLNYATSKMPTPPFTNLRRARRATVRCPAYLIAGSSLLDAEIGSDYREQPLTFYCETQELSVRGASLVIRSIMLDERAVTQGHPVQLILELPAGQIRMEAKPVRCELADKWRPESGYLLGIDVVRIEDKDRRTLMEFLRSLH
jgi:hypothetical protein